MPRIPVGINVNYFFDRKAIQDALTTMEYNSLWRSSILVRRTAQKSIKQVGAARPKLKIQKANPGVQMAVLAALPTTSNRVRRALQIRIAEIQRPKGSPPGTPPYTHVPSSHMLGFRRNLYNAMDKSVKSAVVGPTRKGKEWWIPHLHEAGGTRTLHQWVLVPKYPRYKTPTVTWASPGTTMGPQWARTGITKSARYLERPYMGPALTKSLPAIVKLFGGKFGANQAVRVI
jgi:hypothetical protein